MNKKALLVAVLLLTLLLTGVAGTTLVHLGKANPLPHPIHHYKKWGTVSPDWSTKPPVVSTSSPQNSSMYRVDALVLTFNASIGPSETAFGCILEEIYYETDWQSNKTYLYKYLHNMASSYTQPAYTEYSGTINVTGVPDGNHTIKVTVVESGRYEYYVDKVSLWDVYYYYNTFSITGSSLVRFSVDTTPPVASVLSPENLTCYSPEVLLNFSVSEPASKMSYSLDGQENVAVAGNTTLSNLPVGEHNITVYATDLAGHVGASETIYFSIEEPFPTVPVATASLTSAILVSAGLLIYFKKRKG